MNDDVKNTANRRIFIFKSAVFFESEIILPIIRLGEVFIFFFTDCACIKENR